MKTKLTYITLLSFALCSESSLWAMDQYEDFHRRHHAHAQGNEDEDEWNPPQENPQETEKKYTVQLTGAIRLLGNGKASGAFALVEDGTGIRTPHACHFDVLGIGFETDGELPDFTDLSPLNPLPLGLNFGRSHKRVHYAFQYGEHNYEGEALDTFSPSYPHQGEWENHLLSVEDQEQHQSRFDLVLKVRLEDGSLHIAQTIRKTIAHGEPEPIGDQQTGKLYFNGEKAFLRQYRQFQWTLPRFQGQPLTSYRLPVMQTEQVIPSHEDSEIIFVEPIPISGERLPDPIVGYRGDYDTPGATLPSSERKGALTAEYLIYSDGTNIFHPKVTHELWQRNGWRVGFGIASYNQNTKLRFINSSIKIPSKGLYRLDRIKDENTKRLETWIMLGENPLEIQITTPSGVSSIAGMGCLHVRPLIF